MAASDWNFGRSITPTGDDPLQIRRNFATLRELIAKLEDAIPFFEETIGDNLLMVKNPSSGRSFQATAWKIDPDDNNLMTTGGDLELGDTPWNIQYLGQGILTLNGVGASAVNKAIIQNAPTGFGVLFGVHPFSGDTDVDLILAPHGEGEIVLGIRNQFDVVVRFPGSDNDGVLKWFEDEAYFNFDHSIDVTGDITVSGTVDGEDIQKLKAESSHCLLAVDTEVAF